MNASKLIETIEALKIRKALKFCKKNYLLYRKTEI